MTTTHTLRSFSEYWFCEDCYRVHHYGTIGDECVDLDDSEAVEMYLRRDAICADAYSALGGDPLVTDHTDSETGEGIAEFSWSSCDCCSSSLGGSRYRMAVQDSGAR